jgi:hypothetical protein
MRHMPKVGPRAGVVPLLRAQQPDHALLEQLEPLDSWRRAVDASHRGDQRQERLDQPRPGRAIPGLRSGDQLSLERIGQARPAIEFVQVGRTRFYRTGFYGWGVMEARWISGRTGDDGRKERTVRFRAMAALPWISPLNLWRFDDRYSWISQDRGLAHPPSYHAKTNLMVTTSGVCSTEVLLCALLILGSNNILFAVDYPYQFQKQAVDWIQTVPISDHDRELICHGNSERLFKLT